MSVSIWEIISEQIDIDTLKDNVICEIEKQVDEYQETEAENEKEAKWIEYELTELNKKKKYTNYFDWNNSIKNWLIDTFESSKDLLNYNFSRVEENNDLIDSIIDELNERSL